jgi:hypothetical protein
LTTSVAPARYAKETPSAFSIADCGLQIANYEV